MDNSSCQGQIFYGMNGVQWVIEILGVEKSELRLCTKPLPKGKKNSYTVNIDST